MNKENMAIEANAFNLNNEKKVVNKTNNNNDENDDDDDSSCPNRKTHFYEFKEYKTIIRLIDTMRVNLKVLREGERAYEQFLFICDQYQEQPHLIDPFLPEIFEKLIDIVKKTLTSQKANEGENEDDQLINECFKYMHCLAKMRGYKRIVQHLPHEIGDFEPVLNLLARQSLSDVYTWQTRYLLLLWLSIVCMVPFDLKRFDATNTQQDDTIMKRLLKTCIPFLFASDKCQDASAFLLAKFMSRVDLRETVLPEFFLELFQYLDESNKRGENIRVLGTLKCLACIYKYGKREDLLKYTLPTLEHLIRHDLLATSQLAVVRKFHMKIVQRIGITFFRFKIAKWRYERGSRILMNNVLKKEENDVKKTKVNEDDNDSGEEKIPNEIEDIIEQLLFGLKDKDTIVRWSSAKGIGRITNRLPKDMAEDVLVSVLDLFTFVEDDSAWHGGCLAIAELGRRGLLLPQQLPIVVPLLLKALVFDKKLGNYSLGRNVRDAACYVCWSLARAFEADVIKPYVNQIAGALLIVTVFDREVNCRRAASASFQENVGRQGQFPHGIDILTKCDYHAVGQLQHCYLSLSCFIADFDEYKQPIVDHLLEHKFNHWDQSIRELTSQALFKLTSCCPDYMAFSILPKLLRHSFSIDLNTRHGALISLAEIVHALCNEASKKQQHVLIELKRYFPIEIFDQLKNVLNKIFEEKYFRGTGGELMRPAVCFVLKKFSISKLFQQNDESATQEIYFNLDDGFLNESETFLSQCLEYNKESVQIAAVDTIAYYCDLKYSKSNMVSNKLSESKLARIFLSNLKSTSKEHVRSGYCLAVSCLPNYLLKVENNFEKVVCELMVASKWKSGPIRDQDEKCASTETTSTTSVANSTIEAAGWVHARKDALKALTNILITNIQTKQDLITFNLNDKLITQIFECYFNGTKDYSIDSKGDSGSRIREMAIEGLEKLLIICAKLNLTTFTRDYNLLTNIFGCVMQQAVERIDRTRSIAGRIFANLLYNENLHLDKDLLDYIETIRIVFKRDQCEMMDWNVALNTLPLFVKLLNISQLQTHLLTGLVFSIGSLTESLVKSATQSFLKQLQLLNKTDETKPILYELFEKLLDLCRTHLKNDRLSASLIKSVDLIVQNGFLNDEKMQKFRTEYLGLFLENVRVTKDMQKLHAYVDFFCDMLQFNNDGETNKIRERSMIQLMIMLCHQYPIVRKTTATKLFECLMSYPDLFDRDEDNDECVSLLVDTVWDDALSIVRPIRNRICELTKTPKPVLKKST